ncbi:XkdX family protein [Shimazuella sp. AN120528]|nr:XkdX family protein [Shimazuella soli]MCH5586322.1 XkdX family protein [Shimazuella soli]
MSSRLYAYFYTCWKNGTISQEQLQTAVTKGYITQEEYDRMITS